MVLMSVIVTGNGNKSSSNNSNINIDNTYTMIKTTESIIDMVMIMKEYKNISGKNMNWIVLRNFEQMKMKEKNKNKR